MKTKLLIPLFLLLASYGSAQLVRQAGGGAPGVTVYFKGAVMGDSGIVLRSFADTIAANRGLNLKLTDGLMLRVHDTLYFRDVATARWVKVQDAGSAATSNWLFNNGITKTGNYIQLGGPLVQNTVITQSGFNLSLAGTSGHTALFSPTATNFLRADGLTGTNPATIFSQTTAGINLIGSTIEAKDSVSFYARSLVAVETPSIERAYIASHWPTSTDVNTLPPAILPDNSVKISASQEGAGATGLISLYGKNLSIDGDKITVNPSRYPTGAKWIMTDLLGDGNLTLQPATLLDIVPDTVIYEEPLHVVYKAVSGADHDSVRIKGSATFGQVLISNGENAAPTWGFPTGDSSFTPNLLIYTNTITPTGVLANEAAFLAALIGTNPGDNNDSVTINGFRIVDGAGTGEAGLIEISISRLNVIPARMFRANTQITGFVALGGSLLSTGSELREAAFWGATALKFFSIADFGYSTNVGDSLFWGCTALAAVYLPEWNAASSNSTMFRNCSSLNSLTVLNTGAAVTYIEGINSFTANILANVIGGGSISAAFDSTSENFDFTRYIYYSAGVPVDSVPTRYGINLGNTNLVQSSLNRTYNANNQNLVFSNLANFAFTTPANGGMTMTTNGNVVFDKQVTAYNSIITASQFIGPGASPLSAPGFSIAGNTYPVIIAGGGGQSIPTGTGRPLFVVASDVLSSAKGSIPYPVISGADKVAMEYVLVGAQKNYGVGIYNKTNKYLFISDSSEFRRVMMENSSGNVVIGDTLVAKPTALLSVVSTTKGALLAPMTAVQRLAIASPANGLMVYDTDSSSYFQYASSAWARMGGASGSGSDARLTTSATYGTVLLGAAGSSADATLTDRLGNPYLMVLSGGNVSIPQSLTATGNSTIAGVTIGVAGRMLSTSATYGTTLTGAGSTISSGLWDDLTTSFVGIKSGGNAVIGPYNGTYSASAKLDIVSTTGGVLIPRMTTTQRDAISSPAEGLQVYNLTTHAQNYHNGTAWLQTNWIIAAGKSPVVNASLTLAGTDGTTMTFPTTTAIIARNDAANTFTGDQTFSGYIKPTSGILPSGASAAVLIYHNTNAAIGVSFSPTSNTTIASGNKYTVQLVENFSPTSGTGTLTAQYLNITVNQTGGANGITRGWYINPTLTAAADWRSLEIGNNSAYAIYQSGALAKNYFNGATSIGTTTATAKLTLGAGSATASTAPLKFISGTNLTTPEAGAVEFNGTHFYGTVGSTRYQLDQQSGGSALYAGYGIKKLADSTTLTADTTVTGLSGKYIRIIDGVSYLFTSLANNDQLRYNSVSGQWNNFTPGSGTTWNLVGNVSTDTLLNFIGTQDYKPIIFKMNGKRVGFIGDSIIKNTVYGTSACKTCAMSRTSLVTNGSANSVFGFEALKINTTGHDNAAFGAQALFGNTTGYNDLAIGTQSLYSNTTGYDNVSMGTAAMLFNTTGFENVAIGSASLQFNTSGGDNTAVGFNSLNKVTTGGDNTGVGRNSLVKTTTGYENTAIGSYSLRGNTTGTANVGVGNFTGLDAIGSSNTLVGYSAGRVLPGFVTSITLLNEATFVGYYIKSKADNETDVFAIGANAVTLGSHTGVFGTSTTDTVGTWGHFSLRGIGKKIIIPTGTNASAGTATLVGGTVTVSTTAMLTASKLYYAVRTPGGTQGFLSAPTASVVNATSFVINSTSASETSTVDWWIIN